MTLCKNVFFFFYNIAPLEKKTISMTFPVQSSKGVGVELKNIFVNTKYASIVSTVP